MARNVRAFVGIFTLIGSLGVCGQLTVNFSPSGTWYASEVCAHNIVPNLDNPSLLTEMHFSDLRFLPVGRGSISPDDETAFTNSSDNCIRVNVGYQGLNEPEDAAELLAGDAGIGIYQYDDNYSGVFLGLAVESAMVVVILTSPQSSTEDESEIVYETDDQRNDRVMREMDMCVVLAAAQLEGLCAEAPHLCAPGGEFRTAYRHLDVLTADYSSVLRVADLSHKGRHGEIDRTNDGSCNIIAVNAINIDVDSVEKDSRLLSEVLIHERLHAKRWPGACNNGVIIERIEEDVVKYEAKEVQSQLEKAVGIDWDRCVDWTPQEIRQ